MEVKKAPARKLSLTSLAGTLSVLPNSCPSKTLLKLLYGLNNRFQAGHYGWQVLINKVAALVGQCCKLRQVILGLVQVSKGTNSLMSYLIAGRTLGHLI